MKLLDGLTALAAKAATERVAAEAVVESGMPELDWELALTDGHVLHARMRRFARIVRPLAIGCAVAGLAGRVRRRGADLR